MYENITFTKPNMVVVDSYFYMFDDSNDKLIQKVDDGDTAFEYPFDTLISESVRNVQYDGAYFWTLHRRGGSDGILIRKWLLDNYICKLKETFNYIDDAGYTYDSYTFGVEHYMTSFTNTASGGETVIQIDKYYDTTVDSGTVLSLGPNVDGEREDVTVYDINITDITLTSGIQFTYPAQTQINFSKSLFVFNDYYGTDSAKGTLFRFDSRDGSQLSADFNIEYKNVKSSTFKRFQNIIRDSTEPIYETYNDAYALVYVKDTNAKFRNMADLISIADASSVNDDFTGNDGSLPNTTRWDTDNGNPRIYDDALFCSTIGTGHDTTNSNYNIIGDFDVQVSGSIGGYSTVSGINTYDHYMRINFPYNSNKWCQISRNFNDVSHQILTSNDDGSIATESGIDVANYFFRTTRTADNIEFYYKTMTSGVFNDWTSLSGVDMYSNQCTLELGLDTTLVTVSGSYFDDLIFNDGQIYYPAPSIPYYGTMNIDNVRINGSTIIPVYAISIYEDNLYRLQDEATYYGTDNDWGSKYHYQVSPIRSFVDFITVGVDPQIIPATGRSVSTVTAVVQDQYGEGVINRPVMFTDDDSIGFISSPTVNTDVFFGTGEVKTGYISGTDVRTVTVQGETTQYD